MSGCNQTLPTGNPAAALQTISNLFPGLSTQQLLQCLGAWSITQKSSDLAVTAAKTSEFSAACAEFMQSLTIYLVPLALSFAARLEEDDKTAAAIRNSSRVYSNKVAIRDLVATNELICGFAGVDTCEKLKAQECIGDRMLALLQCGPDKPYKDDKGEAKPQGY